MAWLSEAAAVNIAPMNAWLLVGDKEPPASKPGRRLFGRGRATGTWTGPSQARPGDLLFLYLMAPHKQVRYVARVAGQPYRDPDATIDAERKVEGNQWLVPHTPFVPAPPVAFKELADMHGGVLILRGKPRTYLAPATVTLMRERMLERASEVPLDTWERVVQIPVGDPERPAPATMTLEQWSAMADGPLELEERVEEFIVAPLLRMVFADVEGFDRKRQQHTRGVGIPDWELMRNGQRFGVVETKLAVATPQSWDQSAEGQQLVRYMRAFDSPGMLIDSHRAYLFGRGETAPSVTVDRRSATGADLVTIREHFLGA